MLQFKYSQWQTDLVFLIDDSALWSIKKKHDISNIKIQQGPCSEVQ